MTAIQTRELTRRYAGRNGQPDVVALDALTMDVAEGEIHGLLGPNGAGKTTLVKMLCTILLPTSGTASVFNRDVVREARAVRQQIGIVLGGETGLYGVLTARQNLEFWAALYHVSARDTALRVPALLERVGLLSRADDLVETFSRGMKQRLHLARGLIANARVLFLDEPTIGMDPVGARDVRALLRELRAEGRTLLLTTHDMAEAEDVCDRVTLIDHGRRLAVETPRTLSTLMSQHERIDFLCQDASLVDAVRSLPGVASVSFTGTLEAYRIELSEEAAASRVLERLVQGGVTSLRTSRPSLEEVYLRHIKRSS
ncbi:MAG: ATP-binding cassette domain-containing protein [Vicinamibacterales bacterium]